MPRDVRRRFMARPAPLSWAVFVCAVLFVGLRPSLLSGQDTARPEAVVYLAAKEFLQDLEATAVADEYRCDTHTYRAYGLPIRCGSLDWPRPSLRPVAEALGIPLVEAEQACPGEAGVGGNALHFSPAQFDSAESAWFVVTKCDRMDASEATLYLVELDRGESGWTLTDARRVRDPS